MTEVTANMDRTSAKDTTLDLRVNSHTKLVSNVDVCINASGTKAIAQVDPLFLKHA